MTVPPQQGDVPFERFYDWAVAVEGGTLSMAEMARRSGRSRSLYSMARSQGVIDGEVVVAYARTVGRPPLEALAESLGAEELRLAPAPSHAEMLSQVPYGAILGEVAARLGDASRPVAMPEGGTTLVRWTEALRADSGMQLGQLAKAAGLAYHAYRGRRDRGTLDVANIRAVARATGGSVHVGLVARGWLTWSEADLPPSGREELLRTWGDDAVGAWLVRSAQELKHALSRQ